MTPTAALSIACVVLGAILSAVFASIGFLVKAYVTAQKEQRENNRHFGEAITRLAGQMELLNQGASQGAQTLFRELKNRVDVLETAYDETDDKLNAQDRRLAIVENNLDGHIKTNTGWAHPPLGAAT